MRLRCRILEINPALIERYINIAATLTCPRRLRNPLIVIHMQLEMTTPIIVRFEPMSAIGSTTTSKRAPKKSIMALIILPRLTLSLC
jgi:hypothetical protein